MKDTSTLTHITSSIFNSSSFIQITEKISGENITAIIISFIIAGTVCYVCNNGGSLQITYGDKKVVINSTDRAA